jgi:hypothetical protein
MLYHYPTLNARGLLTVVVSCLLSGQAIADVAGRVNFVSGKVEAIAADGSRRTLTKGELVNSGERLETNKGRVQIRFTDGSFVSLQPNTVFGLDNYAFNKAKPEDGSLLFNFIRGSMRTVSGAIGKTNRANYKVQTPVATIGIRGTGYAATQEPNGRLLLSVSNGVVNLSNNFGSSNVNAGQTFQVQTGQAPNAAPAGTSVNARANTPENDNQQNAENTDNSQKPDLAMGDQVSADGNPLFASFIQLSDGIPRLSSFGSLLNGESGVKIYPNVVGLYSDLSENGQKVGNLVGLIGTEFTGDDSAGKVLLNTRNGLQSLNFTNVQQIGSLSFGEWTNGKASIVNSYLGSSEQLNLTARQFMPYIVGTTAEKSLGNNMKFSYVLAGATPARAGTQVGTLTKLNIDIDLNLMPLVSIDMAARLADVTYSAQLNNTPLLDISFDQKFSGFIFSGAANGLYARSSTASLCTDNKCPVNISAFLSGNDMGVVYEIERAGLNTIGGVAALRGTESSIEKVVTSLPDDCCLPSSLAGTYTALFNTNNSNINIGSKVDNLAAVFDSKSEALLSAFHVVKEGNESFAQDFYGAMNAANTLAANTRQAGHAAKVLAWGNWTNGRLDIGNDTGGGLLLSNNDNVHYLIGLPSAASALPQSGAVRYTLVGGTSSAAFTTVNSNQQLVTVNDVGTVHSGNLMVDFNQATTQLSLGINGFTKASSLAAVNISGSGLLTANSNNLSFNNMNVSALNSNNNAIECTACSASANGLFFGSVTPIANSTQSAPTAAGVTYSISGTVQNAQPTAIQVNGAAGFANPSIANQES